jgi:hypothetical protein
MFGRYEGRSCTGSSCGGGSFAACVATADDNDIVWSMKVLDTLHRRLSGNEAIVL